jgi:general stress protein 26
MLRLASGLDAVCRVLPDGGATLVAAKWLVTAAHVAASIPAGGRVECGGRAYAVARTVIHPEGSAPRGTPPEVDLALVELVEPVAGVTPVALYRGEQEAGKTLVVAGFGDFGDPHKGLRRGDGRLRAVTNVVDDAGPRRIFMRFDAPPGGSEFEGVGGPGDSGGPALLKEDGRLLLAGVSSASMDGKPGTYGVTDVYVRVSTYAKWIAQTIAPAGLDREAVLKAARRIARKARFATFITLGPDGQPQARIVDALGPDDDFAVWVATNPATRKVAEIAKDPRVTISFFEPSGPAFVTLLGTAAVVTDAAVKAAHWKESWAPFYKSDSRGADFTLLKFVPYRLEIVSEKDGFANEPASWRPVTVDFPAKTAP